MELFSQRYGLSKQQMSKVKNRPTGDKARRSFPLPRSSFFLNGFGTFFVKEESAATPKSITERQTEKYCVIFIFCC